MTSNSREYNRNYMRKRRSNPERRKEWNAYQAEWKRGRKTDPEFRRKIREATQKRRLKRRQWFQWFKRALRCEKCSESDWRCLDFHHINPNEKESSIAACVIRWPLKRTWKEIEKCQVLCANCHRKEEVTECL